MNTAIQENALTQTYCDVENLINKIVWGFHAKFGGVFEDWKSEANLIFTKTYHNYKEGLGKFSTYLYCNLQKGLLKYFRDFISKRQPSTTNKDGGDIMLSFADKTKPFCFLTDLVDELRTNDSKTLVNLILEMPADLKQEELRIFQRVGGAYSKSPCHMKRFLKKYLRKIGWTHRRIAESFLEIGEALYA